MSSATQAESKQRQSAAAPSPFTPIAEYAFLSNCHTGALVAPDGAIDWLCVPSFDAPSVFGSLLDREAGFFRFAPFDINHPAARALRARHQRPDHDLEDAVGLGRRARCAHHGAAGRRRHDHAAHAATGRRRRRPPARADGRVPRGVRRDRARLRADLRLRASAGRVDARRRKSTRCRRKGRRPGGAAPVGSRARNRRQPRASETHPRGRRPGVLRAVVGGGAGGSWRRRRCRCAHRARDERSQSGGAICTERGGTVAVHPHRRLRVPLRLPHRSARGPGRLGRLAVHSALRLTQRVREPPRSRGGHVQAGAVRDPPSDGARVRAGDQCPRDDLEDAERVDRRSYRIDDGAVGSRGRDHAPYSPAGRRRRRPHARPHGRVPRRRRRGRAHLRARLRLWPHRGGVDACGRQSACRRRDGSRTDAPPPDRSRARNRGRPRTGTARPAGRGQGVLRLVVGRGPGLSGGPRRRGVPPRSDRALLARAGSAEPACPTIAGAIPYSARRSRSRD